MPYTRIHWIKLETRLLNDPRFFLLSLESQLLYIKILLGLANYGGKLPLDWSILKAMLRLPWEEPDIERFFKELKIQFPKLVVNNGFMSIKDFRNKHNWIGEKDFHGNSFVVPKEATDKISIDKIRIDKIRDKFVSLKGLSITNFVSDDFARTGAAIKKLILRAGNDEVVLSGLDWIADQDYEWTLETLIKKWPDFMKHKDTPSILKKWGKKEK